MPANSDSWGLFLCDLGSLTFAVEENVCALWGPRPHFWTTG